MNNYNLDEMEQSLKDTMCQNSQEKMDDLNMSISIKEI